MCGIAGAVGLSAEPTPAATRLVLDGLAHRGPDAEGQRFAAGTWLGFRRLAIQDLHARADQPEWRARGDHLTTVGDTGRERGGEFVQHERMDHGRNEHYGR